MVPSCTRIIYSNENEWPVVTYNSMDETSVNNTDKGSMTQQNTYTMTPLILSSKAGNYIL